MSKYIIELDDRIKLVTSVGVTENGVVYTTSDYVHNLEELNSDYINEHFGELQDEAYKQGYADAERIWRAPSSDNEFYQKGLEDAWKAARRIVVDTNHGGIALGTLGEIFGAQSYTYIMTDNTAQEAIDKIKAYEHKDSDSIEVGDEVEWDGDCFIVTKIFQPRNMKEQCDGIDDDGSVYHDILMEDLKKTGKHYDIQSILEAMRK